LNPKYNCTPQKMVTVGGTENNSNQKKDLATTQKDVPWSRMTEPQPSGEKEIILLMYCICRHGTRWSMIDLVSQKACTFSVAPPPPLRSTTSSKRKQSSLVQRKSW